MAITVIVRSTGGDDDARLTFDGMQRVVIGRGAGSDVRLPDPSVSHRHASLTLRGVDFLLFDEGSTNGTYVGGARIAPRTSRIVRSGDRVRVGRLWLELLVDQAPVTRDVAAATRDLALALVARSLGQRGADLTASVRVVEGPDQGAILALREDGREYLVGRAAHCDLPLSDEDVSREHARLTRRDRSVQVRDLGTKNGSWLADVRVPSQRDTPWRTSQVLRIGRTVLAVDEPLADALATIESAPDEAVPVDAAPAPPCADPAPAASPEGSLEGAAPQSAPPAIGGAAPTEASRRPIGTRLHLGDVVVMTAALSVLALSLASLVWLLR